LLENIIDCGVINLQHINDKISLFPIQHYIHTAVTRTEVTLC